MAQSDDRTKTENCHKLQLNQLCSTMFRYYSKLRNSLIELTKLFPTSKSFTINCFPCLLFLRTMHYINWPKYFNTSLAQSIKDKIAIVVFKIWESKRLLMGSLRCQILANCWFAEEVLLLTCQIRSHLLFCKPPSLVRKILFYATAQIQVHATCDTWLSLMCDAVRLLAAAPEEDT